MERSIQDLKILEGGLPRRAVSLVLEWAFQHREDGADFAPEFLYAIGEDVSEQMPVDGPSLHFGR